MTGELHARGQVERLSGLTCYVPGEKRDAAEKELVHVLRAAENSQIAAIVVNRWLEYSTEWPTPADLRKLVNEENAALSRFNQEEDSPKCKHCDGTGFITRWYLITYKDQGLIVERRELLRDVKNYEDARNFCEQLVEMGKLPGAKRQTVLSGASACSCLPATNLARTGEK